MARNQITPRKQSRVRRTVFFDGMKAIDMWNGDKGWDILSGRVAPKGNVLVYDAISTHAGSGVADFIASRGHLVEMVTPDVKIADDTGGTTFPIIYRQLYAQGVILTPNYWLDRVYRESSPEGDRLVAVLRNEYTEVQEERVVDQVVIENGILPNEALYWQLKDRAVNAALVEKLGLNRQR